MRPTAHRPSGRVARISGGALLALLLPGIGAAQEAGPLRISLERNSEAERLMATELWALVAERDVGPWLLTRDVLIDERSIPHSHPVLTLHTRHIGDELHLLSTFVHEQLHWLETEPWLGAFRAAMADFSALFPQVPSAGEGGASDAESTYRHLLVCDLELQAMTSLVGEARARETLARITYYEWIYEKVLNDPRVRAVVIRHGFDVSEGVRRP